jgi:hypothetical protein
MNQLINRREDIRENCPYHGKRLSLFSKESDQFYCTSCPYTDTNAIRFRWYSYQPIIMYDGYLHRGVQCVLFNDRAYAFLYRVPPDEDMDDGNAFVDCPASQYSWRQTCVSCSSPLEPSRVVFQFCSIECKYESMLTEMALTRSMNRLFIDGDSMCHSNPHGLCQHG